MSTLFFLSCNSTPPKKDFIEPGKMKLVVWDVMRADEYVMNSLQSDTSKTVKQHLRDNYAKVFAIHQVSSKEFYDSYKYYQSHPILHKELMDSVYAYGLRDRSKLDKTIAKEPKPGVE